MVGFEADGAYAPIKYINGDSSDVIGALLDASVRGGLILNDGTEVLFECSIYRRWGRGYRKGI